MHVSFPTAETERVAHGRRGARPAGRGRERARAPRSALGRGRGRVDTRRDDRRRAADESPERGLPRARSTRCTRRRARSRPCAPTRASARSASRSISRSSRCPPRRSRAWSQDCAAAGVRGVVVISSGFAEVSAEGRAAQQRLTALVRGSGMRMVGPNCMGVLNTDPAVSLNATFAPTWPPAGNVGMLSQSGALGIAVLDQVRALDLGISTLRLGRQQGRRLEQRPALLLGRRPAHRGDRPLPRELRQPAQVRAHRSRGRAPQADRRREVRPVRRRHAGRLESLGGAGEPRHRRRRALRAGRA